jgi:hypothetical protein
VSGFVTRDHVDQLCGVGQSEREDQPVGLGSRKRVLGRGGGSVSIAQGEVRDAGEQVRLDQGERGPGAGPNIS